MIYVYILNDNVKFRYAIAILVLYCYMDHNSRVFSTKRKYTTISGKDAHIINIYGYNFFDIDHILFVLFINNSICIYETHTDVCQLYILGNQKLVAQNQIATQ